MIDDLPLHPGETNELAQLTQAARERAALMEMRTALTAFLDSPAGLMLRDRADAEKDSALAELVQCAPTDAERIRALQARVLRVDSFRDWLFDLLYAGEQAADTPAASDPDD